MKKFIAMLLTLTMVAALFAGCAGNTDAPVDDNNATETTGASVNVTADATTVLTNIWAAFGEDEKFYIRGGNIENAVENEPAAFNLEYAENLTYELLIPADQIANVAEAACMIHGMNANNMTVGAFKLVDGADRDAFVQAMYTAIQTNPYMCGFPDEMLIVVIEDTYVLTGFGSTDAMSLVKANLTEAYPEAEVLYDEAVTG